MRTRTKRPWIAALLAACYPGLGHAYLRSWVRAVLWCGLTLTTVVLVVPTDAFVGVDPSPSALASVARSLPTDALIATAGIAAMNVVDAFLLATRLDARAESPSEEQVPACPVCGRPLDVDLDFCHWCTTRFEEPASDDAETGGSETSGTETDRTT